MEAAALTIGIDPEIHLGPVTLAWHGLTIAMGIGFGMALAARWVRQRGLDPEPITSMAVLLAVAGLVGGRLFYVFEEGGPLLGTRGFTFNGGFILAAVVLVAFVRVKRLDLRYLDGIALWLPLGVAVGRVGDVINGEHYGARSDSFLAVRNSHPDALTPDPRFAYESGGLLEVLLGLAVFAVMLVLARRAWPPGALVWSVLVLFSVGRFFEFFLRSDSPELALGLSNAQWTSVGMLAATMAGAWWWKKDRTAAAAPA
jgi:phosphatidylglycerol---prolipoprotein diacylglyceryl transferase